MIEVPNDEGLDMTCQIIRRMEQSNVKNMKDVVQFSIEGVNISFELPTKVLKASNVEKKLEELKSLAIKQYYQAQSAVPVGRA